jgi:hypothetical protein
MGLLMNIDKAYLFGLMIGGGIWGGTNPRNLRIRLPYRQWGSYQRNPARAGEIAKDILKVVGPMFLNIYGVSITYAASSNGEWNILCVGNLSEIQRDLEYYGINCDGELRKQASLDKIINDLLDDNIKRCA